MEIKLARHFREAVECVYGKVDYTKSGELAELVYGDFDHEGYKHLEFEIRSAYLLGARLISLEIDGSEGKKYPYGAEFYTVDNDHIPQVEAGKTVYLDAFSEKLVEAYCPEFHHGLGGTIKVRIKIEDDLSCGLKVQRFATALPYNLLNKVDEFGDYDD